MPPNVTDRSKANDSERSVHHNGNGSKSNIGGEKSNLKGEHRLTNDSHPETELNLSLNDADLDSILDLGMNDDDFMQLLDGESQSVDACNSRSSSQGAHTDEMLATSPQILLSSEGIGIENRPAEASILPTCTQPGNRVCSERDRYLHSLERLLALVVEEKNDHRGALDKATIASSLERLGKVCFKTFTGKDLSISLFDGAASESEDTVEEATEAFASAGLGSNKRTRPANVSVGSTHSPPLHVLDCCRCDCLDVE